MIDFNGIVGHDAIKKHLLTAMETGQVSHAYLISGEAGSGRKTIADAFALTLLCERGGTVPCGVCHACRQVAAGTHPDVIHVTHEKPSAISVDDIREQITDTVDIRPFSAARKIYIVPDAEKMTVQAQNALLKTIEEPPDYAVIILLSENDEALLDTVKSRLVKLKTRPLPDGDVIRYLTERNLADQKKAERIASFARGNIGKAVMFAGSEDFQNAYEENVKMLKELPDADTEKILDDIRKIGENKEDVAVFLKLVRIWCRDMLVEKKEGKREGISFTAADRILKELDRTEDRLKANVNQDLALEMLLLTISEKTRDGR